MLGLLKDATLLPLSTFVTLDQSSRDMTQGTNSRRLFNAESWALVHISPSDHDKAS